MASDHAHARCYRVGRRSHEQKVSGSSHQELPANGLVLRRFRGVLAAGYPLGARLRRRTSRLVHQKDLQMQGFREAAEGIRTLDLLHGKQ